MDANETPQAVAERLVECKCGDWEVAKVAGHIPSCPVKRVAAEIAKLQAEQSGSLRQLYDQKIDEQADTIKGCMANNDRLRAALDAVATAIGDSRFMDPPDGGDVSLAEQVTRLRAENERLQGLLGPQSRQRYGELKDEVSHLRTDITEAERERDEALRRLKLCRDASEIIRRDRDDLAAAILAAKPEEK